MTRPITRRVDDWRRTALDDAVSLVRVARDLHPLARTLADNELGHPQNHGASGPGGTGGNLPSDPVMRLAVALADPDNAAYDQAAADRKSLELHLTAIHRATAAAWAIYARWTPGLAHVMACANPYGCPKQRPAAVPSRLGLCGSCYGYQRRNLGQCPGAPSLEAVG